MKASSKVFTIIILLIFMSSIFALTHYSKNGSVDSITKESSLVNENKDNLVTIYPSNTGYSVQNTQYFYGTSVSSVNPLRLPIIRADGWLGEYRIRIRVTNNNGFDVSEWPVKVTVVFHPNAYPYSIRVVDISSNSEVPYQLDNIYYSWFKDGYIMKADIWFYVSLPSGGYKDYYIYWSTTPTSTPSYPKVISYTRLDTGEYRISTPHYELLIDHGIIKYIKYYDAGGVEIKDDFNGMFSEGVIYDFPSDLHNDYYYIWGYGRLGYDVGRFLYFQSESIDPPGDVEGNFYGVVFVRYSVTKSRDGFTATYTYQIFSKFSIMSYRIESSGFWGNILVGAIVLDQDGNRYRYITGAVFEDFDRSDDSDKWFKVAYFDWTQDDVWAGTPDYYGFAGLWFPVAAYYHGSSDIPDIIATPSDTNVYLAKEDIHGASSILIFPIKFGGDIVDFQAEYWWRLEENQGWFEPESADGGCFIFFDNLREINLNTQPIAWGQKSENTLLPAGGPLGFPADGYAVEYDTYKNNELRDPCDDHIALIKDGANHHLVVWGSTDWNTWHHDWVTVEGNTIIYNHDGAPHSYTGLEYHSGYIAMSGATGGGDLYFRIDGPHIYFKKLPSTYDFYNYYIALDSNPPSIIARDWGYRYFVGIYHIGLAAGGGFSSSGVWLYYHNEGDYIGESPPYEDKDDYLIMGHWITDAGGSGWVEIKSMLMLSSSDSEINNYGSSWRENRVTYSILNNKVESLKASGEVIVVNRPIDYNLKTHDVNSWDFVELNNWEIDSSHGQIRIENGKLVVLDDRPGEWFELWYKIPIYDDYIEVEFTYTLSGEADGFAFAFYKNKDQPKESGGCLNFKGDGYGVIVDIFKNDEWDMGDGQIALVEDSVANILAYRWEMTRYWLLGTHTIKVVIIGSYVEVYKDGTLLFSYVKEDGFSKQYGYIGFVGATGGATCYLAINSVHIKYGKLSILEGYALKINGVDYQPNDEGFVTFSGDRTTYSLEAKVKSGLFRLSDDQEQEWSTTGTISLPTDYTNYGACAILQINVVPLDISTYAVTGDPLYGSTVYIHSQSTNTWFYSIASSQTEKVLIKPGTYDILTHHPAADQYNTYYTGVAGKEYINVEQYNGTIYDSTYPNGYQFAAYSLVGSVSINDYAKIEIVNVNVTRPPIYILPYLELQDFKPYWGEQFSFSFSVYRFDEPDYKVNATVEWNITDVETGKLIRSERALTYGTVQYVTLDAGDFVAGRKYKISVRVVCNNDSYLEEVSQNFMRPIIIPPEIRTAFFEVQPRPAYIVDAYIVENAIYWGIDEVFHIKAKFKDWLSGEYISGASMWVEVWKGDLLLDSYNLTEVNTTYPVYYSCEIKPYGPFANGGEWESGTYTLRIIAKKGNYSTDIYSIGIYVRPRPTIFLDIQSFISITWREYYVISVKYWDVRANEIVPYGKVTYKILKVVGNNEYELKVPATLANFNTTTGAYDLPIRIKDDLGDTGYYIIQINASKNNYEPVFQTITMIIKEIPVMIQFATSTLDTTWADPNRTLAFKLIAMGDNATWGLDLPVDDPRYTAIEFKDINGTALPLKGVELINRGDGLYEIKVDSGKLIPGMYTFSVYFHKRYYQTAHQDFIITIKKVKAYMDLSIQGKSEASVTIYKNPITGKATAKVEIILREITGVPISGGKVIISVYRGVICIENITVYEDYYVPGLYRTDLDLSDYEPGNYLIRVRLVKFERNGYVAPAEGHNISEYIDITGRNEMVISLDYLGGGVKVAGLTVPILVVGPVTAAVFIIISYIAYKWTAWLSLPPEIRELIKLIKQIEEDNYEYTAPEREDIVREIVAYELGLS